VQTLEVIIGTDLRQFGRKK